MTAKCNVRFVQAWFMGSAGTRVNEALRNDLYKKNAVLPMRFCEESQVDMLLSYIVRHVGKISNITPSLAMGRGKHRTLLEICPFCARLRQALFVDENIEVLLASSLQGRHAH